MCVFWCVLVTQLSVRDGYNDLIHQQIAELHVVLGASLLQRAQDLNLRILLANAPVGHKPHPRAHRFTIGIKRDEHLKEEAYLVMGCLRSRGIRARVETGLTTIGLQPRG